MLLFKFYENKFLKEYSKKGFILTFELSKHLERNLIF